MSEWTGIKASNEISKCQRVAALKGKYLTGDRGRGGRQRRGERVVGVGEGECGGRVFE